MIRVLVLIFLASLNFFANAEKVTFIAEELPPFNFGDGTGFSVEVIKAIAEEAGLEYEILTYPWSRAYRKAIHDKNTFLFTLVKSKQREPLFQWIGIIAEINVNLFKLKSNESIQVNNLEELKNYVTIIPRGVRRHHFLLQQGFEEHKNVLLVGTELDSIRMLLKNRGHFLINDERVINHSLSLINIPTTQIEKSTAINELSLDQHLATGLNTQKSIVEKYQAAYEKIRSNGTYENILQKWNSTSAVTKN